MSGEPGRELGRAEDESLRPPRPLEPPHLLVHVTHGGDLEKLATQILADLESAVPSSESDR